MDLLPEDIYTVFMNALVNQDTLVNEQHLKNLMQEDTEDKNVVSRCDSLDTCVMFFCNVFR